MREEGTEGGWDRGREGERKGGQKERKRERRGRSHLYMLSCININERVRTQGVAKHISLRSTISVHSPSLSSKLTNSWFSALSPVLALMWRSMTWDLSPGYDKHTHTHSNVLKLSAMLYIYIYQCDVRLPSSECQNASLLPPFSFPSPKNGQQWT